MTYSAHHHHPQTYTSLGFVPLSQNKNPPSSSADSIWYPPPFYIRRIPIILSCLALDIPGDLDCSEASDRMMNHWRQAVQVVVLGITLLNAVFMACSTTHVLIPQQQALSSTHQVAKVPRYAVATFVDEEENMYGIYSIRNQMKKFGMNIPLVTVTHPLFIQENPKLWSALQQWFPPEHIHVVDKTHVLGKVNKGLWAGTFNKLFLFNLTEYDKLITLDQDVLIRRNIMHWFEYPAPCAIQAKDNIEWNSGAMVIEPNKALFDDFIQVLLSVHCREDHRFNVSKPDSMESGHGQQGFLAAYFTQRNQSRRMCTLPTEFAPLSSSFEAEDFQYFLEKRLHIFETIHFPNI